MKKITPREIQSVWVLLRTFRSAGESLVSREASSLIDAVDQCDVERLFRLASHLGLVRRSGSRVALTNAGAQFVDALHWREWNVPQEIAKTLVDRH